MTGLSYFDWGAGAGTAGDADRFTVDNPGHWALANTGLTYLEEFGEYSDGSPDPRSVVGSEVDRFQPAGDPDVPLSLLSPANLLIAARVYVNRANHMGDKGTMGSFVMLPGTGEVFNAGTIGWASGLFDESPSNEVPQITRNVINRLGPGFHQVSPGEVSGVRVAKCCEPPGLTVDWTSVEAAAGPGTEYDVVRGLLSTLRSSGYPAGATCRAGALAGPPYTELLSDCATASRDGCWYLVRAKNSVGLGTYGPAALDGAPPCPP